MIRKEYFFEFENALLHYSVSGSGDKVLLCFHGFGQSNEHFKSLEKVLATTYTIYSFDLFYHGRSFWHEREKPLSKEFWNKLLTTFFRENAISTFDVLGYSMGGKFALATLENFYPQIEKIILIAPDGVKTNFWYSLATYPLWMRKLFRSMIIRPSFYFKLVNVMGQFRIVDKGILRFANTQMISLRQRRRVYYSWVVFRLLRFNMKSIASIMNNNKISLEMYLGEYDKIITLKNMELLLNRVEDYSLHVLKTGHNHLIDEVAEHYRKSNNRNSIL